MAQALRGSSRKAQDLERTGKAHVLEPCPLVSGRLTSEQGEALPDHSVKRPAAFSVVVCEQYRSALQSYIVLAS